MYVTRGFGSLNVKRKPNGPLSSPFMLHLGAVTITLLRNKNTIDAPVGGLFKTVVGVRGHFASDSKLQRIV